MGSVWARTKYFSTIWIKWDDVSGTEHFNTQSVVSEVDPDLQEPELCHGNAGLLGEPLPVVLGDELLGVELGQAEHQVDLPELRVEDPLSVQTPPVSKKVLAQYL